MDVPSAADIRLWSKLDFDSLEYEEADPDPLTVLVERAKEYVEDVTRRFFAEMPPEFELTAAEALQRRVEQLTFKSQEDEAETASDIDMVASISAGSYHETRINLERATKFAGNRVNPWPLLNDLLWRMMTEDRREEWREWWGTVRPAFEITEVDWSGSLLPPPITEQRSV